MASIDLIRTSKKLNTLKSSREISIIPRDTINGITEMIVEGVPTYLGEVKNFKNNTELKMRLPKDLSISWTRLPVGPELPTHFHPCSSLVVVTKGKGQSLGDTEAELSTGDIVYIPEWNNHGFTGTGSSGFHALSIQFQETAIFDDESKPETTYEKKEIPIQDRQLTIVKRETLPSIHEVIVNGQKKQLGTLGAVDVST